MTILVIGAGNWYHES